MVPGSRKRRDLSRRINLDHAMSTAEDNITLTVRVHGNSPGIGNLALAEPDECADLSVIADLIDPATPLVGNVDLARTTTG